MARCLKRGTKSGELIRKASQSPNITRLVVARLADELRRHVVRGSHVRFGELRLAGELSRKSKVPKFDVSTGIDENVRGLNVSVQDGLRVPTRILVFVAIFESKNKLGNEFPDVFLLDVAALCAMLLDQLAQVTSRAVLHDNVQLRCLLVNDTVTVLDNERVAQLAKEIHFSHNVLLLALRHFPIVKFLPDQHFAITFTADESHCAETPFADCLKLCVAVHAAV